jgi:hypothetical protein
MSLDGPLLDGWATLYKRAPLSDIQPLCAVAMALSRSEVWRGAWIRIPHDRQDQMFDQKIGFRMKAL